VNVAFSMFLFSLFIGFDLRPALFCPHLVKRLLATKTALPALFFCVPSGAGLDPQCLATRPAPERTRSVDVCGITRPHRTTTNIDESSLCIFLPSLSISVDPSQKLPDVKKIRQSRSATALESSD